MSMLLELEIAKKILQAQPFSALIGAEISELAEGKATLTIPIRDDLKQQNDYIHGGVISYLADNTISFAAGTVLGSAVLTAEYKVNYLTPAVGEKLIARAWVIHSGKRQAVCRCDIFAVRNEQDMLVAAAQGTIVKIGV